MSKVKAVRCEGCGVPVQTESPEQKGYIPEKALEREVILCQRCFRIRHYGDLGAVEQDPEAYLRVLDEIAATDSLVVLVVDLFDFAGSWIPGFSRRIGKNPVLLVANKVDLFPKTANWKRLRDWVSASAREMGVHPVDTLLCSSAKGLKIPDVMQAMEHYREGRDIYIVGTTNVGKSTLINRLLREAGGTEEEMITTSPYPGTTLDTIRIPLEDGKEIIDTPGIVRKDRISEWVDPKELKIVVPNAVLRPKVYQLNDGQTLFFGGLARLDYVQGTRQPFVTYMSNRLYVHRTKLAQADEIWQKHRGELLAPPKDPAAIPPLTKHVITLSGKEKEDIVIAGLGWVACGKEKARVELWVPEGIQVSTRAAII